MNDFIRTQIGKIFLERSIPELNKNLNRIAEALESQNKLNEKKLVLEKRKLQFLVESAKSNDSNV